MQFFLYEFITGGGLWQGGEAPGGSLLREGAAMLRAVAADFACLPKADVWTLRDARLPPVADGIHSIPIASADEELAAVERLASAADWTLLIAPETGGALLQRCQIVERCRGRLLSPPADVVAIATNKQATAELLSRHGVPVPAGGAWKPGDQPPTQFPFVVKPLDGCGSQGVELMQSAGEFARRSRHGGPLRYEELVPGCPTSVSVLCGPAGNLALPACQQQLSTDGRFQYLGGRLPLHASAFTPHPSSFILQHSTFNILNSEFDTRARRLALAALSGLPQPRGYVGVDLVLGPAEDGNGDRVIEINPRLTTSYVGLRAACRTNLAEAMLKVAVGEPVDLCFDPVPVTFEADGTIYRD